MAAPTAEALAIARHVHDFVWDWIPSHLTPSAETARSYRTSITLYVTWLSDCKGVTPSTLSASDLSTERVEGWLSWLATERGNSPQTRDVRLSALRTFACYVSRHDATLASVEAQVASVPFRKAPKTKVGGMSEAAVSAVLKAPGQSSRAGRRDTALMVTLYSTACRVGELLPMRKSDVFLDGTHPHAVVRGKGGKVRVVYLTEATVRHLRSYIDEFCRFEGDGHLFWSRNHPPGERPLSQDAVSRLIAKHASTAREACPEVPDRVTAHTFRHARATHWLDAGLNLAQVSLLLGHASVATTMRYLDISVSAEEQAMRSLGGEPREKRWKSSGANLLELCGLRPLTPSE